TFFALGATLVSFSRLSRYDLPLNTRGIEMARRVFLFVCAVFLMQLLVFAQGTGPTLNVLDQNAWRTITSQRNYLPIQLDLLLLRANASMLDDPSFMKYFILLNQCGSPPRDQMNAARSLNSEFDYPGMASFYKSKAADVAKVPPDTFTITMAEPYGGGGHYLLGEWDPARKAFPFVDAYNKPTTIKFDNVQPGGDRGCAQRFLGGIVRDPLPVYRVLFPEQKFTELQMPEDVARQYTLRHGDFRNRHVTAIVEVQVLPDPPQITKKDPRSGDKTSYVTFHGKMNKVTIITDDSFQQVLGAVYP